MWESSSKASWMCVIKTGTSTKNSRNLSKTNGKKNESQIEPLKGKDTEISWQRKKHSYTTIVIITIVSFKNIKSHKACNKNIKHFLKRSNFKPSDKIKISITLESRRFSIFIFAAKNRTRRLFNESWSQFFLNQANLANVETISGKTNFAFTFSLEMETFKFGLRIKKLAPTWSMLWGKTLKYSKEMLESY